MPNYPFKSTKYLLLTVRSQWFNLDCTSANHIYQSPALSISPITLFRAPFSISVFGCWKTYATARPDKSVSASGTTLKSQRLAVSQSLGRRRILASGSGVPMAMHALQGKDQAISY